jgi:hypothetical protein
MLEVELDIFSGMPNPTWALSDEEERELIGRVSDEPAQLSPVATMDEQFSLGYRGLIVRLVKPTENSFSEFRLPSGDPLPIEFRVGSKPATTAAPVADWLLETAAQDPGRSGVTDELREAASGGVALVQSAREAASPATLADPAAGGALPTGEGVDTPTEGGPVEGATTRGATWWACGSNYFSANAQYFNDPAHVTRNNCYCFASNHLADIRYALPGKRGGHPATSITCGGVIDGLYADGWRDGCQPNGLTIVLVIWPGNDYHFYRLVTGGPYWWWGHKPGGTPAKYTDDCGNSLYQYNGSGYAPNNCCRGYYADFCGYFYQDNNTAYVA